MATGKDFNSDGQFKQDGPGRVIVIDQEAAAKLAAVLGKKGMVPPVHRAKLAAVLVSTVLYTVREFLGVGLSCKAPRLLPLWGSRPCALYIQALACLAKR